MFATQGYAGHDIFILGEWSCSSPCTTDHVASRAYAPPLKISLLVKAIERSGLQVQSEVSVIDLGTMRLMHSRADTSWDCSRYAAGVSTIRERASDAAG
jgi:hypothetical protein